MRRTVATAAVALATMCVIARAFVEIREMVTTFAKVTTQHAFHTKHAKSTRSQPHTQRQMACKAHRYALLLAFDRAFHFFFFFVCLFVQRCDEHGSAHQITSALLCEFEFNGNGAWPGVVGDFYPMPCHRIKL